MRLRLDEFVIEFSITFDGAGGSKSVGGSSDHRGRERERTWWGKRRREKKKGQICKIINLFNF